MAGWNAIGVISSRNQGVVPEHFEEFTPGKNMNPFMHSGTLLVAYDERSCRLVFLHKCLYGAQIGAIYSARPFNLNGHFSSLVELKWNLLHYF
jgi:hypothetical protein